MRDSEHAWRWAVDAVAGWLQTGQAPRDVLSLHLPLRREPPSVRAAAAQLARETVARWRWLAWALAGDAGIAGLAPRERAAVLVAAGLCERGDLPLPAGAGLAARMGAPAAFDFSPLTTAPERLRAVTDPVRRLALSQSLPDWAAQRFVAHFGDDAEALAAALGQPPPRTIRANLLRIASRDALARELADLGIPTRPAAHAPHALHVDGDADLFATDAYARGAFEQQDEASQLGALATAPPPGGKVLDLCAGGGGKTLALAAAMRNRGAILATDVQVHRLEALRERARRAGVDNTRAMGLDDGPLGGTVLAFAQIADRILVDAPCSGTGSWRRRPEGRWALAEGDLAALTAAQDRLLDRAAAALKPGARLVYATCSVLPEENEQRIAAVRARCPWLEPVRLVEILGTATAAPIADATGTFLSLRPDRHGCDGFFAAVLRRPRGS